MNRPIKKAFIVITHFYRPSKTEKGKWEVEEKCEFVDSINNRMETESTVIIDFKNKKIEKSRMEDVSLWQLLSHVEENHPQKYKRFKELVENNE